MFEKFFKPKTPQAYVERALATLAKQDEAGALRLLEDAVTRFPDSKDAWEARLHISLRLGASEAALESSTRLLELVGDTPDGWYHHALALRDAGRDEDAEQAYRKVVALDPAYADAWINLGALVDDHLRHDEAIEAYERALAVAPDDPDAWSNKGNSLSALGRFDEAAECYERASALGHPDAIDRLRSALAYAGRDDEVHALASRANPAQGELRVRTRPLGDKRLVARYFIGQHSNPELLDRVVDDLLDFAVSRMDVPPGITDGVRIQHIWPVVTVKARGEDLVLCEPRSADVPKRLQDEVSFTAFALVLLYMTHSLTKSEPEPCRFFGTVRVQPEAISAQRVVMQRDEPVDDNDTGWVILSDPDAPVARFPLLRVTSACPHFGKVLTLPFGWSVHFDGTDVVAVLDTDGNDRFPAV